MANYTVTDTELTSIADAIRTKGGTSTQLEFPTEFVSAIQAISTGTTPTGTKQINITGNGTTTEDVAAYASAEINVNVPNSYSASDEGKVVSNGALVPQTTLTITGNGTVNTTTIREVTVDIAPAVSGGVNFIDYDGTILYSYSVSDFMALTELPANPSHSGLTAQGWNWTLADAKAQLTAMPDAGLTIGQMYITDDGKTRIYCRFEEGRLHPYLGIGVNGTVIVDWGDGSSTNTLTGTSLTTAKHTDHTYAAAGDYIITLTVSSGSFSFFGVSGIAHILKKSTATTLHINKVYANAVQRLELGENAQIGDGAFYFCSSLTGITIPASVTSIGSDAFGGCYNLTGITIPAGVTSIESNIFDSCYSLANITIPAGVTSIGTYAFYGCSSLTGITIPAGVTSIESSAFYGCSSLTGITIPAGVTSIESGNLFRNCYSLANITILAGVTSIGTYAFYNCYSLANITIPAGVTSIGTYAFYYCYGLGEIHFCPTTPPTVSNKNAWTSIPTDCIIYVPSGTLAAYTSATNYPSSSTYTYVEE